MAHKEANHSSTERTILWIIIPATVLLSLMFTRLNHKMVPGKSQMDADFSLPKKEATHAPAAHATEPAAHDTTHAEPAAPAEAPVEAPAHH